MESEFPHLRENVGSIWDDLHWPSWLEIGVIVCILLILGALLLPADSNAAVQAEVDAKVASHNEALAPKITPDARILALDFDGAGGWRRLSSRGPYARIERIATNHYRASFESGTCSGSCRLPRDATFAGGILLLDQPVAERHFDDPFRRLYAVRVGERRFLVPDCCVANFERALSADKSEIVDESLAKVNSYQPEQ